MSNRYSKNKMNRDSNPPDLDLYVKGSPFHLHKEVLAKKSAKVAELVECNKIDELSWILRDIDIDPRTFLLVVRFCHGYKIQLTSENIVSILCVSYYLEMNDDHSSNNLLNKAVMFFEQQVLTSWDETLKALCVCTDKVLDRVSDIGLTEAFLDSLVEKALKDTRLLQDLIVLPLRLYEPLILDSTNRNVDIENLVVSVCNYAKRWVFEGEESVSRHKREVVEAVERLLPNQRGAISCGFLFKLLKESVFLDACDDCRKGFEVRISKQLDMATSKEYTILFPKEVGLNDVELLKNILKGFYSNYSVSDVSRFVSVAKALEEFLLEVAAGLRLETFKALGEIVFAASCEVMRYSDGIYRAIDAFLEGHKDLIESEKMEACRVLECERLSPEACEHASTNEKLPLRIVVKVVYFSQKQIRDKMVRERVSVKEKAKRIDEDEEDEEEEEDEDEVESMSKKLLRLEIEREIECCGKKKKVSVWREVKRKFGCLTSSSAAVDACNCHVKKKRKKTYHHYK